MKDSIRKGNFDRMKRLQEKRRKGRITKNCSCFGGIQGTWEVDPLTAQPVSDVKSRFAIRYWCIVCGVQAELTKNPLPKATGGFAIFEQEEKI